MNDPALIRSAEVARRMGIAPSTLWDWRRAKTPDGQRLRSCIHRGGKVTWWHVGRLRAAGLIPSAPTIAAQPEAAAWTIAASGPWVNHA